MGIQDREEVGTLLDVLLAAMASDDGLVESVINYLSVGGC